VKTINTQRKGIKHFISERNGSEIKKKILKEME
jgi:hypothetical protein